MVFHSALIAAKRLLGGLLPHSERDDADEGAFTADHDDKAGQGFGVLRVDGNELVALKLGGRSTLPNSMPGRFTSEAY